MPQVDPLEPHFRRGRALLQSLSALLLCCADLDQTDGASQAIAGCIFLVTELGDEIQKLEELSLWLTALAQPKAND